MSLTWSNPTWRNLFSGDLLRFGDDNVKPLWPTDAGTFAETPAGTFAGTFAETGPFPKATRPSPTKAFLLAAPRAYLLLGEEATPRGTASVARAQLFPVDGPAAPDPIAGASDEVLGAALYRVATDLAFGTPAALSGAEMDTHWTIGALFPLPVWATDAAGVRTWHVDVDRIVAAIAVVVPSPSVELGLTSRAALVLHAADATASAVAFTGGTAVKTAIEARAKLKADLAVAAFPTSESKRLLQEARWNPYAVLFRLIEVARAFGTDQSARAAFAAAFWGGLTAPERAVLGATSAGHAWARQLWLMWGRGAVATDAGRIALKAALHLADDDLAKCAPGVVGELEPPMLGDVPAMPSPSRATVGKKLPVMAFGRRVDFQGSAYPVAKEKWEEFGIRYGGTVTPAQYFMPPATVTTEINAALFPGADAPAKADLRRRWTRILAAISVTEGAMDAATTWDRAMASLGCQQFSMHEPKEGATLLERLKALGPDYYDLVVRSIGIETGRQAGATPTPSATGVAIADVDQESCFFTLTPTGRSHHFAPGTTSDDAISDVRANVFDWVMDPDRTYRTGKRAILLCARWAVAARYGIELWQAQAELSVHRIARTAALIRSRDEVDRWTPILAVPTVPTVPIGPTVPGGPTARRTATVFELFGTEALQGLVVDMMINTSGYLGAAMRRAVLRALADLQSSTAPTAPLLLDAAFWNQLTTTFLVERRYRMAPGSTLAAGAIIDIAPDRIRQLMPAIATAESVRSAALSQNPKLQELLRSAGIQDAVTMSPTALATWP